MCSGNEKTGRSYVPFCSRTSRNTKARNAASILFVSSSPVLPGAEPFDRHRATVTNFHLQFVTSQEPHPDQWVGVGFSDEDLAHFPVPVQLAHKHLENVSTAIAQYRPFHASTATPQCREQ